MVEYGQAAREDYPQVEVAKSLFGGAPEGTRISGYEGNFEVYAGTAPVEKNLRKGIQSNFIDYKKALTSTLSVYAAGNLAVLIPVYVDP
jgi:hypothetical protein